MSFLKEMFGTEKPILGLLHLKPLPGDPFYAPHGSLDDVIACARADLDALQSLSLIHILTLPTTSRV